MASQIVICKDIEEALRMFDAGLLMLRVYLDEFQPATPVSRKWVVENYGMSSWWPPNDFGYLVDDEDG